MRGRQPARQALLAALAGLLLLLGAPAGAAAGAALPPPQKPQEPPTAQLSYDRLLAAVAAHEVQSAIIDQQRAVIKLTLRDGRKLESSYPLGDTELLSALSKSGAQVEIKRPQGPSTGRSFLFSLPFLLMFGAFFAFIIIRNRRRGGGARPGRPASPQSMGLRKGATDSQSPAVRFADVAGCEEAVEELQEMLDFLKHPERYHEVGARMPSAVLLYGPPGTGKTLLAKALAGEAGVPFYAVSGSEFVEMYVGIGAKRIRDLFQKAKAHKEGVVVFIDELDAIGRSRAAPGQMTNDERDQTLNQLLVELDGFGTSDRVIVVAATNRLDVLDPALLRPGRFGRQIAVDLPSEAGREAILAVHAKGKPIDHEVDIDRLAKITGGLSGAQLAEVVNEAAIMAARSERKSINQADFDEGTLRVLMGPEKRSSMLAEGELEVIAYHEAGHVLAAELCPHHEKAHRATVRPRGRAAGLALYGRQDRALHDADYIHEQMVVALGGRAAEQIQCGKVSSGAANDLMAVNQIARRAIEELGLSPEVGQLVSSQSGFASQRVSEETLAAIDREVERLVHDAYRDALRLLDGHRSQLTALATLLVSQGDLERVDIVTAIEGVREQKLKPQMGTRPEPQAAKRPVPQVIQQPFASRRGLLGRTLERSLEWIDGRGRGRAGA